MKMIGVSRIVLWPQRVAEVVAAVVQQRRQPGMRGLAPPALQDADASAVRQAETADVQRVRRGVFTAPRLLPMVDIAAGEAAEMIDLAQIARHQLTGQRFRLLLDIQRTAQRQRAAGEETAAQRHAAKIRYPHHVMQRAASLAVGHRLAGDKPAAIGFRQQGGALVCRQPAQLE